MSEKNTKKSKVEKQENVEEIKEYNITIDLDKLTINDLEMLSIINEGTDEDRKEIPGFRVIQFLKRIGGRELGELPQNDLESVLQIIAAQINEARNPKEAGKN